MAPQSAEIEQKIKQVRDVYADAPEMGRVALENVLRNLKSELASRITGGVKSAGRIGYRQGNVSELTVIAPFTNGGAKRLRALLGLLEGNFQGRREGRHRPRHALRVPGQRHEVALRHRL